VNGLRAKNGSVTVNESPIIQVSARLVETIDASTPPPVMLCVTPKRETG